MFSRKLKKNAQLKKNSQAIISVFKFKNHNHGRESF